jgi:NRPS condensation-like uncharacterized protein
VCHFTFGSYVAQGFGLHTHFKLQSTLFFTKLPERLSLFRWLYSLTISLIIFHSGMSFSNIGNDSLYILFLNKKMQKKSIFCCCFFFTVFVLRKTVSGKSTTQGGMLFPEVTCILGKKRILGCFLGTILKKDYHQKRKKYLFPALVFNLDTLMNIAFDQV